MDLEWQNIGRFDAQRFGDLLYNFNAGFNLATLQAGVIVRAYIGLAGHIGLGHTFTESHCFYANGQSLFGSVVHNDYIVSR